MAHQHDPQYVYPECNNSGWLYVWSHKGVAYMRFPPGQGRTTKSYEFKTTPDNSSPSVKSRDLGSNLRETLRYYDGEDGRERMFKHLIRKLDGLKRSNPDADDDAQGFNMTGGARPSSGSLHSYGEDSGELGAAHGAGAYLGQPSPLGPGQYMARQAAQYPQHASMGGMDAGWQSRYHSGIQGGDNWRSWSEPVPKLGASRMQEEGAFALPHGLSQLLQSQPSSSQTVPLPVQRRPIPPSLIRPQHQEADNRSDTGFGWMQQQMFSSQPSSGRGFAGGMGGGMSELGGDMSSQPDQAYAWLQQNLQQQQARQHSLELSRSQHFSMDPLQRAQSASVETLQLNSYPSEMRLMGQPLPMRYVRNNSSSSGHANAMAPPELSSNSMPLMPFSGRPSSGAQLSGAQLSGRFIDDLDFTQQPAKRPNSNSSLSGSRPSSAAQGLQETAGGLWQDPAAARMGGHLPGLSSRSVGYPVGAHVAVPAGSQLASSQRNSPNTMDAPLPLHSASAHSSGFNLPLNYSSNLSRGGASGNTREPLPSSSSDPLSLRRMSAPTIGRDQVGRMQHVMFSDMPGNRPVPQSDPIEAQLQSSYTQPLNFVPPSSQNLDLQPHKAMDFDLDMLMPARGQGMQRDDSQGHRLATNNPRHIAYPASDAGRTKGFSFGEFEAPSAADLHMFQYDQSRMQAPGMPQVGSQQNRGGGSHPSPRPNLQPPQAQPQQPQVQQPPAGDGGNNGGAGGADPMEEDWQTAGSLPKLDLDQPAPAQAQTPPEDGMQWTGYQ